MKAKLRKPERNRLQKRALRTRCKLKEAALDVFSEKSVDAATIEEITEKADLGKGTLYQHFEDKEEIVATLVEEALEHLIENLCTYDSPPETLEEVLEHLLNAHYEFSIESREEFLLLFQGKLLLKFHSGAPYDLEKPYLRYLEEIEEQVSDYISPRISPLRVRQMACAAAGLAFGFFPFAMISMTEKEVEKSIAPLRRAYVKSLVVLLGR